MEWIGCTVCEVFAFKVYCDLETRVLGHSRSPKMALFDRAHMTLYSSSIVTMPLSRYPFRDIAAYWSKISTPPLYLAPPLGWSRLIYATTLGDQKLEWWAYQMVKEFRWYVQPFWHKSRVWQTDRQTDGIGEAYTRYSMLSLKMNEWMCEWMNEWMASTT